MPKIFPLFAFVFKFVLTPNRTRIQIKPFDFFDESREKNLKHAGGTKSCGFLHTLRGTPETSNGYQKKGKTAESHSRRQKLTFFWPRLKSFAYATLALVGWVGARRERGKAHVWFITLEVLRPTCGNATSPSTGEGIRGKSSHIIVMNELFVFFAKTHLIF